MRNSDLGFFYAGDKVMYDSAKVWYIQHNKNVSDGNPLVGICDKPHLSTSHTFMECPASTLTLIERGNHFKLQAGLPLVFEDFIDEVRFWKGLGLLGEVENPETKLFVWASEAAVSALEKGEIDLYLSSTNLPGMSPDTAHNGAYRAVDRSIGDRLRAQCLKELQLY